MVLNMDWLEENNFVVDSQLVGPNGEPLCKKRKVGANGKFTYLVDNRLLVVGWYVCRLNASVR